MSWKKKRRTGRSELMEAKGEIVAKALDGQRYPLPLCEFMWMCDGERGSGPEGADDLCLVGFEALGLNLSINYGFKSQGPNSSLEAQIKTA